MNEENQVVTESQQDDVVVDYKSMYEKAQEDIAKIAAKKDELYQETKKAKQERAQANEAAQKAAEEKAQKDGEFEKLWQTAKDEKDELHNQLQAVRNANRAEKIQIAAMRVATELADGDNAELLSDFIQRNLDKLADDSGVLQPDVLEAVKEEFNKNTKFKSLLRSSKANGGGATGNTSTKSQSQELSRAEFAKLSPMSQQKFFGVAGNKLVD